jgi:hypothetical protein
MKKLMIMLIYTSNRGELSTENRVGNQNQGILEQAINRQQIATAIADLVGDKNYFLTPLPALAS